MNAWQDRRLRFLFFSFVFIVTATGLSVRCGSGGGSESEPRFKEVKVERGTFEVDVSANGVVIPIDRIEMKSKASGEIVELPVEEGDFIHRGDLIARLDQRDERAAVAEAQADFDIATAVLKQAERSFERGKQLYENNLISEEERDQVDLNLATAKGKYIRAKTVLDRAQERLNESIVRAPVDGIILQKYVEKGQIIASGVSNVSGGTPIVDIADMKSVYIEAGIDEIDIGKIQIGQRARVVADAYSNLAFYGRIVRISPEAKIEQNVTLFDVIVEVENTDRRLKSGMNATIEITIVNKENVLLAPAMAVREPQGRPATPDERIVLLKQEGKYVPHKVTVGLSNFKQVEIVEGLTEESILGVPMTSRLKEENDRMESRIRDSRGFNTGSRPTSR